MNYDELICFGICGIKLCWEKAVRNTWPGETMELWWYEAVELVYGLGEPSLGTYCFGLTPFEKCYSLFIKRGVKSMTAAVKEKIFSLIAVKEKTEYYTT